MTIEVSESLWVFVFVAGAFRADELSVSPVLSSVVQFQKVCAAVAGDADGPYDDDGDDGAGLVLAMHMLVAVVVLIEIRLLDKSKVSSTSQRSNASALTCVI